MLTRLISVTSPIEGNMKPEALIAYLARVSSPNQDNPEYEKLISYCIQHKHWSIFEMVDMTVEIETSRTIAAQILRHRSFSFQELSQRFSDSSLEFELYSARRKDSKNRQNSIDDLPNEARSWFYTAQGKMAELAETQYKIALEMGIARECARFLLPPTTRTRLYMKGSIRSWIHYLQVRCAEETQKEHRDIANSIRSIFIEQMPTISKALGWVDSSGKEG